MGRHLHFSETDVRLLVSGSEPGNEHLAGLAPLVRALRAAAAATPSDEAASRFSRRAAPLTQPATRDGRTDPPRKVVSPARTRAYARLAGAMGALVMMLSASLGVAYAADGSVPGDPLHGLDLAMENMGIGNGGFRERLSEANSLIQSGRVDQGLIAAAVAIAAHGGPADTCARQAAEALLAAADAVAASADAASASVRAQVAERLRFMATTDLVGKEFGQAISDLAWDIESQSGTGELSTTSTTKHTTPTNNGQQNDHSNGDGKDK